MAINNNCTNCQSHLAKDEIAIYCKLINRGATEYLCIDCLAEYLKCSKELIEEKIIYFREMGCTLFCKNMSD